MPRIAAIFPGQGSHAEGMDEPFRGLPAFDRGLELLGFDPFERLDEGTRFQQPAIFLCSVAAWDLYREEAPDEAGDVVAAAGHSLGEYTALVAAGVLAFDDAVPLVAERAAAMAEAGEQSEGSMLAMLGGDDHAVRALATRLDLTIANDNAPGQLVLSGRRRRHRAGRGGRPRGDRRPRPAPAGQRRVPLAAHGARRRRAWPSRAGRGRARHPAASPSTPTAPRRRSPTCARELSENLLGPVRWRETLLALRAAGVERFVEHGPGAVLTGLVKRTLAAA